MDDRIKKLSNLLVNYSTSVQPGEKVLINYEGRETLPLIRQLIKDIYKVGGLPYVESSESSVTREILLGASTEQIEMYSKHQLEFMKEMDAYIGVRGSANTSELSDGGGRRGAVIRFGPLHGAQVLPLGGSMP